MGTPALPHAGVESDASPFVVRPVITNAAAALNPSSTATLKITDVTLTLAPNIGVAQRAMLILSSLPSDPISGFVSAPIAAPADSNQVTIPIHNVPTGTYLVRVQIAGAESPLTMSAGVFNGPTVTMP
jgi:hypothetical protein